MSKVFDCSTDNVSLYLINIFKDNELDENSAVEDSSVTASEGKIRLRDAMTTSDIFRIIESVYFLL